MGEAYTMTMPPSCINHVLLFLIFQAVEKRRNDVKKLQKKTQKNHSEKYLEKEQKSLDDLHQLSKQLLSFRSQSLREVSIQVIHRVQ